MKNRNIGVCILLSIITCGLYGIYWYICLTDEANDAAREEGTSGITVFLFTMVTCGIYSIYWAYRMGEKLKKAKQSRDMDVSGTEMKFIYLFLCIFGLSIIGWALMQREENEILEFDDSHGTVVV